MFFLWYGHVCSSIPFQNWLLSSTKIIYHIGNILVKEYLLESRFEMVETFSSFLRPIRYVKHVRTEGEFLYEQKNIFLNGVTLIFAVISGCSGNTEAKTPTSSSTNMPVSTATSESTSAQISKPAVLTTQQPAKVTESIVYENTKNNFSLKIPKSWNGKYEVEDNGDNLRFVYKANNGTLFSITIWSKEKWSTEGAELVKNTHISKIGEKGDKIYTLSTPTDVQVVPSDKNMAADYNSMWEDIEGIKATFELK